MTNEEWAVLTVLSENTGRVELQHLTPGRRLVVGHPCSVEDLRSLAADELIGHSGVRDDFGDYVWITQAGVDVVATQQRRQHTAPEPLISDEEHAMPDRDRPEIFQTTTFTALCDHCGEEEECQSGDLYGLHGKVTGLAPAKRNFRWGGWHLGNTEHLCPSCNPAK